MQPLGETLLRQPCHPPTRRQFVSLHARSVALSVAAGRLLDLQDDLAAAVFWMAGTWSAELPVPRLRFRSVPLEVPCDTRADLDRVARVLDAGMAGGRVVRSFGRVRIEAVRAGGRAG